MDKNNVFNEQVGGDHYKDLPIGPTEYAQINRLTACESAVVKYVTRHRLKGGKMDIEKAIHHLQMILSLEYSGDTKFKGEKHD